MRFVSLVLILSQFLCAAALAQEARHFTRPREAVDAMIAAVAARDAQALAGLYVADALVMSPNQPVISGRPAIRDVWAQNFANGYSALNVLQMRTESGADRALTLLLWEATFSRPGQPDQTLRGRSALYIAREPEGWLISADMWHPAP